GRGGLLGGALGARIGVGPEGGGALDPHCHPRCCVEPRARRVGTYRLPFGPLARRRSAESTSPQVARFRALPTLALSFAVAKRGQTGDSFSVMGMSVWYFVRPRPGELRAVSTREADRFLSDAGGRIAPD